MRLGFVVLLLFAACRHVEVAETPPVADAGVVAAPVTERRPPRELGDGVHYPGARCPDGCSTGMKCCNTGRAGSYACMPVSNDRCPPRM